MVICFWHYVAAEESFWIGRESHQRSGHRRVLVSQGRVLGRASWFGGRGQMQKGQLTWNAVCILDMQFMSDETRLGFRLSRIEALLKGDMRNPSLDKSIRQHESDPAEHDCLIHGCQRQICSSVHVVNDVGGTWREVPEQKAQRKNSGLGFVYMIFPRVVSQGSICWVWADIRMRS